MLKEEKIKYWIFYSIFNGDLYGINKYEIYAFTDNIELAEEFVNTRNMQLFYMKTIKMTIKERNEMFKDGNMNRELELYEGYTKNKKYELIKFTIPITRSEKIFLYNHSSLLLHEKLYEYLWKNFSFIKSKYKKALKILLFTDLSTLITEGYNDIFKKAEDRLKPDEFNILMWLYKDTFIESGVTFE